MQFKVDDLYHIYNRGNNKQPIFFNRKNYLYFLKKVRSHIYPLCEILAWCLMPNHFHFLINANEDSVKLIKEQPIEINALTEGFRLLLSGYTQGINRQENRTGNLFQQKTKLRCIAKGSENYGYAAFNYIHQNPVAANLVSNLEDWEFSSFADYAGIRNGQLCNKELAFKLFDIDQTLFLKNSHQLTSDDIIKKIM
jgi:REP element-mobilizing transposase RayT